MRPRGPVTRRCAATPAIEPGPATRRCRVGKDDAKATSGPAHDRPRYQAHLNVVLETSQPSPFPNAIRDYSSRPLLFKKPASSKVAHAGRNRPASALNGIPATELSVPVGPDAGAPASVPEIALAKTTDQRGVAKVACFAYHRQTGRAFWQSGVVPVSVNARERWALGIGPFKRGSLYDRNKFVHESVPGNE